MPVLVDSFPHKRFDLSLQRSYVTQLLHMCEYMPALQSAVLDLIISKCLEIDVEIQIEESGDTCIQTEFEDPEEREVAMFQLDDEDGGGSGGNRLVSPGMTAPSSLARQFSDVSQRIPDAVVDMADKLDVMLSLTVDWINQKIESCGVADLGSGAVDLAGNVNRLFVQLLSVFEDRILVTHRSKFVQFLLFFVSARVPRFGCAFADRLSRIYSDVSSTLVKRQSAVIYLASFVSRSTVLDMAVVR